MTSDPIADMLTRVRNAMSARHAKVDVPASKLKTEIARILKEEGYIANFKVAEEGVKKVIKIYLKYASNNSPVITRIERVSRPGCRVYVGRDDSTRARRIGHQHSDDSTRGHDRPDGAQRGRRRRVVVPDLVNRWLTAETQRRRENPPSDFFASSRLGGKGF